MADEPLRARFRHFYLPKNDPSVLRRNALVVMGNQRQPDALGLLAGYLGHRDATLRLHAAWAVGQLAPDLSEPVLMAALERETHPEVVAEIQAAIGA